MNTTEILKTAVNALEDKKAQNPVVLDISNLSVFTDHFIIASGDNKNQLHAMADNAEEELAKIGLKPRAVEGYDSAGWILMDYTDFVIHIFDEEERRFYDLERIWGDGIRVSFS